MMGSAQTCEPAEKRLKADCVCEKCETHFVELNRLSKENASLKAEVGKWKMDQKFLKEDNERVKYYTGLPHFQVLIGLHTSIWLHVSPQQTAVTVPDALPDTRVPEAGPAHPAHGVPLSRGQENPWHTFNDIICALNAQISPMVRWPRKDALNVNVPLQVVEVYGKQVAVILDCFEIETFQSRRR